MKIIEKEFNVQTGQETINEREMTTEELAHLKAAEAAAAEAAAAEAARAELLARLGITADEAKLLLG